MAEGVQIFVGLISILVNLLVVPEFRRRFRLDDLPGEARREGERITGRFTRYTRVLRERAAPGHARARDDRTAGMASWLIFCHDQLDGHQLPAELAREIDGRPVGSAKQVIFRGDARCWLILEGRNGYRGNGLPARLREELGRANREGVEIRAVAFGQGPSWLLLRGDDSLVGEGLPPLLEVKLQQFRGDGLSVKDVALGPAESWVILLGRNGFRVQGVPRRLRQRLGDYNVAQHEIRQVVLTPTGGWVVLYGRNGFSASGVPAALIDHLRRHQEAGRELARLCIGV